MLAIKPILDYIQRLYNSINRFALQNSLTSNRIALTFYNLLILFNTRIK